MNSPSFSNEQFNFDVTEVEIQENGNKFFGKKGGTATTDQGLTIKAEEFEYDKLLNILIVKENIQFDDKTNKIQIFSDKATYLKNKEKVFTEGNSKAIDENGIIITANTLSYNKNLNLFEATGDVKIVDKIKDFVIFGQKIKYNKNKELITSFGETKATIESKYFFESVDVIFSRKKMQLTSNKYSTINENNMNFYELEKFKYFLNDKVLKGQNAHVTTNVNQEKSDDFYFNNIFVSFKNKKFKASETKVLFHKNIFDKERKKFINLENAKLNELFEDYYEENNPRLYGVSSAGDNEKTVVNKGIFTSCKKTGGCPAWSLESEKIIHDKNKKQIIYKDTVLKIYDFPVFYFPKFFHPDPSVVRQSGFLKPQINESEILGSSFYLPYFHVISESKDITFKPTIFDSDIIMLQNEYRQKNKNSFFIADVGLTKGYKSSIEGSNKNNITHLFSNFKSDLKLDNFSKSDLEIFIEKTSNDTYLRLFDANIPNNGVKPNNLDLLKSGIIMNLDKKDEYNLSAGTTIYENLSGLNSDRFQYVFPYYSFSKSLETDLNGNLNFGSSGSYIVQNTNNSRTKLTNNLSYNSEDYFSNFGFRNNFGIYFKNFNATAKNDSIYKSNLQSELMGIFEARTSLPLIKYDDDNISNSLTPKLSFRYNPTNMKNYSTTERDINVDNVFSINRLGIGDSFESGRSLTLGLDFKKESLVEEDKFFEFNLATVIRDKFEQDIPTSSTINRKNSNLFGSITNHFSEFMNINYDFSLDNNFNTFEYNSISAEFSLNKFVTEFNFVEKNGLLGDVNSIENTTSIKIDNNNYFTFNTRRNRKTSLTEYYDLVYEYKNDCLTAGIKYKKTYYSDRDIKPNEDLLFTVTLFPIIPLEQKVDQNLYRD